MNNIEYSYILDLYNKTYNENMDEEQFNKLLKTKYKKTKNKISLKNELLKTKEQEIIIKAIKQEKKSKMEKI